MKGVVSEKKVPDCLSLSVKERLKSLTISK